MAESKPQGKKSAHYLILCMLAVLVGCTCQHTKAPPDTASSNGVAVKSQPPRPRSISIAGVNWCLAQKDPRACLPRACNDGSGRDTRKTVVLVGTDWCGYCKILKEHTLTDPRVKAKLKGVGRIYIDADRTPGAARAVLADGYPHTVVLDDDCTTILGTISGYVSPKLYLIELEKLGL